jgi:hypothetical protein
MECLPNAGPSLQFLRAFYGMIMRLTHLEGFAHRL